MICEESLKPHSSATLKSKYPIWLSYLSLVCLFNNENLCKKSRNRPDPAAHTYMVVTIAYGTCLRLLDAGNSTQPHVSSLFVCVCVRVRVHALVCNHMMQCSS